MSNNIDLAFDSKISKNYQNLPQKLDFFYSFVIFDQIRVYKQKQNNFINQLHWPQIWL